MEGGKLMYLATRAGALKPLDSNEYQCGRCGIRNTFGGSTPSRPELCRDCKWVLDYREPEPAPPKKPRPPIVRLPDLSDAECLAARNAMRRGERSPEVEAAACEYWRRCEDRKKRNRAVAS